MAIIVPARIYVGYQERKESTGDIRLGFATYIEKNAAFEKRKETITNWSENHRRMWNDELKKYEIVNPLEASTFDNMAMLGFTVAQSVRRYGWGSGNVLWRIEDPRGFELEISSANMASVLDCATIVKGVIQTPCVWGWNKVGGSRVVLLPVDSEPYKEAIEDTKRTNSSVSLRDVKLGDVVELKNGFKGKYLGSHYWVHSRYGEVYDFNQYSRRWDSSEKKTYFFSNSETEQLFMMASPKVSSILEACDTALTIDQAADVINEMLMKQCPQQFATSEYGKHVIFVSPTIIGKHEYVAQLDSMTYDEFLALVENKAELTGTFVTLFGSEKLWMVGRGNYYSKDPQTVVLDAVYRDVFAKYCECRTMVKKKELKEPAPRSNYFFGSGSQTERDQQTILVTELKSSTFEKLSIVYKNNKYPPRI